MVKNKNLIGVGCYRAANAICDALIKTYGCVFIYKISNSFDYVI